MKGKYKNPLGSLANQFGASVDSVLQPDFELNLGHVDRVFSTKQEIVGAGKQIPKGDASPSQMILITATSGILPTRKKPVIARPLLRGFSDSITRGDLVLYTTIAGKRFYLGPLNTTNDPNFTPDHTYRGSGKGSIDRPNGYSKLYPGGEGWGGHGGKKIKKMFKNQSALDGADIQKVGIGIDLYSKFTDTIIEGRHGNGIRIGSRKSSPQLMITNNVISGNELETAFNGSNISLTSTGTLLTNFSMNELSCDRIDNPRQLKLGYGGDESLGENKFDNDYKRDQIIMFSDRITFDARSEEVGDLTLSAKRNINLGAGKNFTLTTIGNESFSVLESHNIYLGKEAKKKTQPMVLGNELRVLLLEIMQILNDSRALVQGVALPLNDQTPTLLMKPRIDSIIRRLEDMRPEGIGEDRIPANPFLSQYHYVEPNLENESRTIQE